MNKTFTLSLIAAGLFGALSLNAFAGTQAQLVPVKKTPAVQQVFVAMPAVMKCMPGYSKTDQHINTNGATDRMECTSPVFECPDKSKVKNKYGTPAAGQGIDIEKIPVGPVGDTNRFKIRYSCTYYWPQG